MATSLGAYAITIGFATLAGAALAVNGYLEQREASSKPEQGRFKIRLMEQLVTDRVWLLAMAFGFLSYVFQAVALAFGPLSMVQPLVLSELIFAVPFSIRRHHRRMGVREWVGILSVAGGLAVGLVAASPRRGNPLPDIVPWAITIGVVAVLAAAAVLGGRRLRGPAQASILAIAAASVLGLQSAFLDSATSLADARFVELFTHWQGYAIVPATVIGIWLMQVAYQAGPLAASMPVVDAFQPSVAIAIGVVLFGEPIATGTWNLVGTGFGLAMFFCGIVLLDTSPLVRKIQRLEQEEREGADRESAA
ncbi:MAG TPA: DMT family transporter [Actinomycetota bacterium]|nr:DMT family transporter [Actinomycetota bacterium]